jgi:BirA family biotin operon repressor/biotin-[acetyl-CoA-carboxylase] ligase
MKAAVLELLKKNPESYVSGSEISRTLDISRTAVWKHIRALREEGYRIESRSRRGYRLRGVPDLLIPEEVRAGLTTRFCGRTYYHYPLLASTNDRAKELAWQGAPEGTTVLAEEQSGGRGRLGRSWHSPRGGLWFSVVLRPALPPVRAPEATFVAAVAGTDVLRTCLETDEIGIKWPNDFVWRGKKLGGILTELSGELDRINHLVVGIGLNVNLDPGAFPAPLSGTVTSVQEIRGRPVSRANYLRRILTALERWYLVWLADGFAPVLAAWKRYNACLDRNLRVSTPEGELAGRAVDVDRDGALLLDLGGEIRRIVTGELFMEGDVG